MAKAKPFDSLFEIADRFDEVRNMNSNFTEQQVLDVVVKVTGQTASMVKKRWQLLKGIDWPVLDYLERGVIGMTRATTLIDNDLSAEERTVILNKSLDENIPDSGFKEYMQKYLEEKEEAEAEAEA
jgi:hypothetical protein